MLAKQVTLITGAAGRIGAAAARAIVAAGGRVALADIDADRLGELQSDLGAEDAHTLVGDATTAAGTDTLIAQTLEHFGQLDAAIHAAYPRSKGWGRRFEDLQEPELNQDLARQLGGAILFSQRLIAQFKQQGHGNLIHVSSIQGIAAPKFKHYQGTEMTSPIEYSAIKAGIIAITRYLAKSCKGHNIRVNCISPGGILDNQPANFLERYRADCNDKGMLDAADVAGTLVFLLSEQSRYITGQTIVVDDGWSL
ncbi:MAG: SDR family oxidoreductase [Chromatiaceae bacterium]|nr:SDR family oxidoreductase [Chromatiaceae bacterium]